MARASRFIPSKPRSTAFPGAAALHRALLEIVSALEDGTDLHTAMTPLFRVVERCLFAECFFIVVRQSDAYQVLFETDLDDRDRRVFLPVPRTMHFNQSPIMQTLVTRDHALVRRTPAEVKRLEQLDIADRQARRTTMGNTSRRSSDLLFVPIRFGREFVGMITVQNYRSRPYGPGDVARLQTVAGYVSLALQAIHTARWLGQAVADVLRQTGEVLDGLEKHAGSDPAAFRRRIEQAELAVSRLADNLPATQA